MSLADTILKKIRAERNARFKKLGLPTDFIAPNYGGRSIVNVAASVIKLLGGDIGTPALDAEILGDLTQDVRRIVFVVVDALGYQRLLDALETKPRNGFHALLQTGARIAPLTSVFPSTTTAALTALWTGYTPAEHGFMGYQMFLRDYGVRADMITFSPVATRKLGFQQLLDAGLKPENFLAVPSLPQTLAHAGVPVYHFIEKPFVESALSQVQIRGAHELHGFITSSDMWVALRNCVEEQRGARAMFAAYWSAVDSIAHLDGPSAESIVAEINNFAFSFEREFLARLSPAARKDTLFLLTADHGQVDSPIHRAVYLNAHPDVRSRLLMDGAGDARAAYLYCRNGEVDAVRDYFATRLADQFFILDARAALDAGLFGTGIRAPEAEHRIGDLIVLPRDDAYLLDKRDEHPMLGRHGGLAEDEMLVPLIAARLD
ncbi:MAG: alkaline phosphatase family protein [Chloroflexi bacterium]|nr:alkaline phosphatase family protein [Chloroflexota bacterium]